MTRGGGPRAVRYAAAITEEDDLALRRPSVGLGRVFFVVLMMHIVAVGGILAFKWLGKDDTQLIVDTTVVDEGPGAAPAGGDSLPPVRTSGKPIVVDHPDPELQARGYKRYRVALNEQLPHVARQFNGSVAEYEKINGFRKGEKLYAGQWITVVDHRDAGVGTDLPPAPPTADDAIVATPVEESESDPAEEPDSFAAVVETQPATGPAHERLTPISLPDSPPPTPAPAPSVQPEPEAQPALPPQPQPQPRPRISAQPAPIAQQTRPIEQRPPASVPRAEALGQPVTQDPVGAPAPRARLPQPVAPRASGPVSPIWRKGALDQLRPLAQNPSQNPAQPVSNQAQPGRNYRVVTGDTAYGISRRFGVDIQQLLGANNMTDARQLQAGQVIRIP